MNGNGGGPMAGSEDAGVVEVMASPETDGPFTEDMINQVIAMLQSEGQITQDTHTVIVHTTGGPTLRVQIQQVDSTELEQDNIEEIGNDETPTTEQDQLVYVGQAGEEYQVAEMEEQQQQPDQNYHQQQQQQHYQQQQYKQQQQEPQQQLVQGMVSSNDQHILENGGQFVTMQDQEQVMSDNSGGVAMNHVQFSNTGGMSGIPATVSGAYLSTEQVMQAGHVMDGVAYTTADSQHAVIDDEMKQQQGNEINGTEMHTTSLHNGVVLSYEAAAVPQPEVELLQQSTPSFTTPNGIMQTINNSTVINGHAINSQKSINSYGGSKTSSGTQYVDATTGTSSKYDNYQNVPSKVLNNRANNSFGNQKQGQGRKKSIHCSHTIYDNLVKIQIDTGRNDVVREDRVPPNCVKIYTTTGQFKTRAPKFFRCTTCAMHFASENALMLHIKQSCVGTRKRTSYECTYCSAKFNSKVRTVEHLKVCTLRYQLKNSKNKSIVQGSTTGRVVSRKPTTQTVEVEINSDDEEETAYRQEKTIVYDDDDDDMALAADNEDYETTLTKVTQKHLGPILTGGKYKCRDCERTFNKDAQYKRHIGACTNVPLNSSRIDDSDMAIPERKAPVVEKKPRGRPPKSRLQAELKALEAANKAKQLNSIKPRISGKVTMHTLINPVKDDICDVEWDLSSPRKDNISEPSTSKKSNQIMDMLKENLGDGNLDDGSKELSESFLKCLDDNNGVDSKTTTPVKETSTVCGLCVRPFDTAEDLATHISSIHAKDVVNMHSILSNNTDLKTHKCPMCQLHFVSTEGVREHIVANHLDSLHDTLRSLRINSSDLPCPWCSHKSMSKELFQQHLASQHTHKFPETALIPTIKPEELDSRSLKAGLPPPAQDEDMLNGRVCLSCGATFLKHNKLEQHMTKCSKDNTPAQHPCYFPDCSTATFDSVAGLVAHIEEEHSSEESCERRQFPNSNLFGTWLKQEQQRSGYKYTRATSRIRAGCCHTTYLCHNYSNCGPDKTKPAKPCYARLHVRTRWCHSKFDYCGRTEVTYYKDHKHTPVSENTFADIVEASKTLKVCIRSTDRVSVDDGPAAPQDHDPTNLHKTGLKPKPGSKKVPAAAIAREADEEEAAAEEEESVVDTISEAGSEDVNSITDDINTTTAATLKTGKKSLAGRPVRTPVPKLPFTPEGKASKPQVKPKMLNSNNKRQREESASEDEQVYPNKRKLLPKNSAMRGRLIVPNAGKNVNNNIRKQMNKQGKNSNTSSSQPPAKKTKVPAPVQEEETTYVLPANLSEWCKLFDMVDSQILGGSLKKSCVPEAKQLLKHQTDITSLALEEQVRVFHRLCNLANIQVD